MSSSAAQPLHGTFRNGFNESCRPGARERAAMFPLSSNNLLERHQGRWVLQTSLNQIMERFRSIVEILGTGLDAAGVLIVVGGAVLATARVLLRRTDAGEYYRRYRQDLGRAILLGLEFLIAGDIIRTVVVAPTLQNVLVLGLIVLIRTFLSLSLQLEIEGKLPWSREGQSADRVPPN